MWRGWPLCIPLLLTALMALGLLLAILSSSFSAMTMTSAALHSALVPSKSITALFQRVLWPPLVRSVQRLTGLTSVYGTLWGARTASETSQNTLKMLGWRRYVGSSLRRATGAATAHVWRLMPYMKMLGFSCMLVLSSGVPCKALATVTQLSICRGVGALAFSSDGRFLVAVALDNVHSVMVFDWRCGTVISEGRGFAGEPPQARSTLL